MLKNIMNLYGTGSAISLRDLYCTLAHNTSGSHVKVYNAHRYGSVYSNTMSGYIGKTVSIATTAVSGHPSDIRRTGRM